MALIRFQPRQIFDLRQDMNRFFGYLWGGSDAKEESVFGAWTPAVDVAENDESFVFSAELPGMKQEAVKVSIANNVVSIQGEKKQDTEDEHKHRTERVYGSFNRTFSLPSGVNADKAEASFKDGVLCLVVPKKEEEKAKIVEVKVK